MNDMTVEQDICALTRRPSRIVTAWSGQVRQLRQVFSDTLPAGHATKSLPNSMQFYSLLAAGGRILICAHVNSSSSSGHRAAHFMTVKEHLSTFQEVGFIKAREVCPAADLSLMAAEKP